MKENVMHVARMALEGNACWQQSVKQADFSSKGGTKHIYIF